MILPLVIDRVFSFLWSCPYCASVRDCAVCAAFLLCPRTDLFNLSIIFCFVLFLFILLSSKAWSEKAITLTPHSVYTVRSIIDNIQLPLKKHTEIYRKWRTFWTSNSIRPSRSSGKIWRRCYPMYVKWIDRANLSIYVTGRYMCFALFFHYSLDPRLT